MSLPPSLPVANLACLLTAAPNFRDIGGLVTTDGRPVRSGLIYRSDALDELDAPDLERLGDLAIKVCCDLRSDGERLQRPSRWPAGKEPLTLTLAVATDIRTLMPELVQQLRKDPGPAGAAQLMRSLYQDLPLACAPVLRRLFSLVIDDPEALPLVVHCTAGKDRTGFVISMLLEALGVSDETIMADYLRSNEHANRPQGQAKVAMLLQALTGVSARPETIAAIMEARSAYLEASLTRIQDDHGSTAAYLDAVAGLNSARREQLRQRLLQGLQPG